LVGGTEELIAMLRGVGDLKAGQPSPIPEFFGFENWQQVVEFVRSGEGEDLLTEDECDFVVSTAHKAKGREWPNVRLMEDFLKSLPKREGGQATGAVDPSELRLLYVALTRAQDVLEVPSGLMEFLNTGELPASALTPRAFKPQPKPSAAVQSQPTTWERPTNWTPSARSAVPTADATGASNGYRQTAAREFNRSQPARIDDAEGQDVPPRPTVQEPPSIPTGPVATTEQSKKRIGFLRWLTGG
jgi:ATP-dependent exoDNAse (exonuclease V) beta subunit